MKHFVSPLTSMLSGDFETESGSSTPELGLSSRTKLPPHQKLFSRMVTRCS